MKWIFLAALLVMIQPLSSWLRANPRQAPKIWALLGCLPFVAEPWNLEASPINWPLWPGHARGIDVSLIDAIALAIILSRPRVKFRVPFLAIFAFYIFVVTLSVFQASVWTPGFFYVWQLVRVTFLFVCVATIANDERAPLALVSGMAIGLAIHASYSLLSTVSGAVQTGGAFEHQNQLGLLSHFAIFPSLAILLASKRGWTSLVGTVSGAITTILTASRATIGLVGIGALLLLALSCARRMTSRKVTMAFAALLMIGASAPLAMLALDRRYEAKGAPDQGYDERAALKRSASAMLNDNPFGVGPNQYVVVANTQGYSRRAGVAWTSGSALVHNVYWLIATESGYLGTLAFILLPLRGLWVAFRCAFKFRKDPRGEVMLGLAVSLLMVSAHGFYEWIFISSPAQYLLAVNLGLIAGIARQMGYWSKRRPVRAISAPLTFDRPGERSPTLPAQ